jgi:hypothetical protein
VVGRAGTFESSSGTKCRVSILLKRTVPLLGTIDHFFGKVALESKSPNVFYRPDGTETFVLCFRVRELPNAGLLSNVLYGDDALGEGDQPGRVLPHVDAHTGMNSRFRIPSSCFLLLVFCIPVPGSPCSVRRLVANVGRWRLRFLVIGPKRLRRALQVRQILRP